LQDHVGGNAGAGRRVRVRDGGRIRPYWSVPSSMERPEAIEKTGEIEHLGKRFFVGVFHAGGGVIPAVRRLRANLRGEAIGDGKESGRD